LVERTAGVRIPIESSTSYRGRHSRPNWLALLAFVGLGLAVGALGASFSPPLSARGAAWYASLTKPAWTPPIEWFGPIWLVLYVSMAMSAWFIWGERYHRGRNAALGVYACQLLLNAAWAPLFFGTRNTGVGLLTGVALWLAVVWTIREFAAVRARSAWLMVPYLGWVTFGVVLNLLLWRQNP
jgi:tryptophan-rich sensory protein